MKNIAAVVLAGGKGTRMNSELAKVLHQLNGRPIVYYILDTMRKMDVEDVTVVIFHQAERVADAISRDFTVKFAQQSAALGTADAFKVALPKVNSNAKAVFVFYGDDSAFYTQETLQKFMESHLTSNATVSILGVSKQTERPVGGIFREESGNFEALLEPNQYLPLGKKSNEINCAYIFDYNWAKENINQVPKNEQKGEYYITELPNMAKRQGLKVNIFIMDDPDEWIGVNTQEELEYAEKRMAERLSS